MGKTRALTFTDTADGLAQAIQRNDSGVLKALYQQNFDKVKAYVLKNSGDVDMAKDLYQEAFVALWKRVKQQQFEPKTADELGAYLYTIAKNKWLDVVRSKRFKNTQSTESYKHLKTVEDEQKMNETTVENDQKLQTVIKALEQMDTGCRELLNQFYYQKKSMQEIGAALKLDPASARNKKYRCMQKLKTLAIKSF